MGLRVKFHRQLIIPPQDGKGLIETVYCMQFVYAMRHVNTSIKVRLFVFHVLFSVVMTT
jgi:hypothetical protein